MANWKKIIVSGSNAHLNQITSSVLTDNNLVIAGPGGALENSGLTLNGGVLNAQGNSIVATGASTSLTGSFSGSFIGNGSLLTGLVTTLDVSGSNGSNISIDLKTQDLTITGTANEIETSAAGTTLTIGLPNDVTIGNNVKVQNNVSIYDGVTLENDIFCGPSMVFTNVYNPRSAVSRKKEYRRTVVKNGATLGANCTIVCGVTIGEYSFIAAGSVINRDVKPYALMAGVPARQIGWMSRNGQKLALPLSGSNVNAICPATGENYFLINGQCALLKS
jgi:UDP-2-acetamido-3-amino-2,3-dideoxy-glucuronate N-acetyltransferase